MSVLGFWGPKMSLSSTSLVLQGVLYTQHAAVSPGAICWIEKPPGGGGLFWSLFPHSHFLRLGEGLGDFIFMHFRTRVSIFNFLPLSTQAQSAHRQ